MKAWPVIDTQATVANQISLKILIFVSFLFVYLINTYELFLLDNDHWNFKVYFENNLLLRTVSDNLL